jgi:tetratricopeptide (TPR) repeat protein
MIEKLFRSFRTPFGASGREDFTLEEEVALYRHRADVALEEERYSDALVFLAKILRLNPYDLQARMTVAHTYHYALKEPTKALLTYEKVIAASGYDESNSYSVAAREGIQELSGAVDTAALPLHDLVGDEAEDAENTDTAGRRNAAG